MENVIYALDEIQKMNRAYDISVDNICGLQEEIAEAKVCTPIIGKFSSGKSALVNTLLGYTGRKILKEDITPETAVPAEIIYTDDEDQITVFRKDGTNQVLSVEDHRRRETDAETEKCVRIQLRNHFLEEIPDVMLVGLWICRDLSLVLRYITKLLTIICPAAWHMSSLFRQMI